MLGIIVDLSETRKLIVIDLLAARIFFRIHKFFVKTTIWKLTMGHTGSGTKL